MTSTIQPSSTPELSGDFYIPPGAEAHNIEVWGQRLQAAHRFKALRDLAEQFNHYAPPNEPHPINLTRDPNDIALILELWLRGIKIPELLTFGRPYDTEFRQRIEVATNWDVRESLVYQLLQNPENLNEFLYFSLLLPARHVKIENKNLAAIAQQNLKDFNRFWVKLPVSHRQPLESYDDLRDFLRSRALSWLDLVYIALKAEEENIFNVALDINVYLESVGLHPFRSSSSQNVRDPAEPNELADDDTDMF